MAFEENLQQNMFSQTTEKTYIDKLLARSEIDRVKELIRKSPLTRAEILELLNMCASAEAKLVNLGAYDRYVILKFFVWIREFLKTLESLFDFMDDLYKKHRKGIISLQPRSLQILSNNQRLMEHNAKFLIDLYFNIMRTTLSLGGSGFMEILKNKYEINYQMPTQHSATPEAPQRWGLGRRKVET